VKLRKNYPCGDAAMLPVNVKLHKIYRLQVEHPLSICNLKCFPQILRPVTIIMRIRGGESIRYYYYLMPFPLCSGNLGRGTAVESSGFTGRLL
jgi:hypothetical protein